MVHPGLGAPPAVAARVSLCMIVKDEAANLPACLATAADLVGEVVIVDTGSTDATKAVAATHGARVHDFAWCDDFAAARNESLRHATGDWIFWLDADDRIDAANRERLRHLFAALPDENVAYVMTYLALAGPGGAASAADHVQLFRNHPAVRWEHRVHEQILPAVERAGGSARRTDIVIHHLGYQDAAVVRRKLERNLRLLRLEQAERPDDAFTLFNLGRTALRLDQVAAAVEPLRRAVATLPGGNEFMIRTAHALLIEALGRLGQPAAAFEVVRAGRARFPNDPELLLADGIVRRDLGDRAGAEACLVDLLRRDPGHAVARAVLDGLRAPAPFFQITVS